jgi:hypothetical protein
MFSRLRDLLLAQSACGSGKPGGRVDWKEKQPIDNKLILLEKGAFLKLEEWGCG